MKKHYISRRVRLGITKTKLPSIKARSIKKITIRASAFKQSTLKKRRKKKLKRTNTLRAQLNRAIQAYKYDIARRQALYEVMDVGTTDPALLTKYQNLDYDQLIKQGTTRYVQDVGGYKQVKFKGRKAVRLQIESLKRNSNSDRRKEQFITNYIKSMREQGFTFGEREQVRRMLKEFTADELNIALIKGTIRDIHFVYSMDGTESDYDDIKNSIKQSHIEITDVQRALQDELTGNYFNILTKRLGV